MPTHSESTSTTTINPRRLIQNAHVVTNTNLCRDHWRLTLAAPEFPQAGPGQFVHLAPPTHRSRLDGSLPAERPPSQSDGAPTLTTPMLRRAYSIADLRRDSSGVEIDVIYRVVGVGTRWMSTLRERDLVSVLGPLGNQFPIHQRKRHAWLIAGGVGLPPMLWLANALKDGDKSGVAFLGAQTRDLLAVHMPDGMRPDSTARDARFVAEEFARQNTPVIVSTDDGSLGFHGHIGDALTAYANAHPPSADDCVVYTCGPERMMRFVAQFCIEREIECHACLERAMACGTGTCQSCVVAVRVLCDPDGWRYSLCCTEGPVYDVCDVLWSGGPISKV